MISNKLVNLWRGIDPPPTMYHLWIYDDLKVLIYNGNQWITFINDIETVNKLIELLKQVNEIEQHVSKLLLSTINNKQIIDNPVLTGEDLLLNQNGIFIKSTDNLTNGVLYLDLMMNTLIIE